MYASHLARLKVFLQIFMTQNYAVINILPPLNLFKSSCLPSERERVHVVATRTFRKSGTRDIPSSNFNHC